MNEKLLNTFTREPSQGRFKVVEGELPPDPLCHECGRPIPHGEVHITREVFGERYTWHIPCGFLR